MSIARVVVPIVSVGLIILGAAGVSIGQTYPNKIIRIVTAAAGGGSDLIAREIAQGISGPLGQAVIVENRGSGIILYEFLSKAPPDGYGLVVTGSTFWIEPLLRKAPYDALRDFSPLSQIVREVNVLAVHPSVPINSVKGLIALAKARPGDINYSSGSIGGPPHLAMELFKSMAGVNIMHVPYKGSAKAVVAVIAGESQLTIYEAGLVMPHVRAGRLKALAATSLGPSALTPGLPTVAASGLPGYESTGMTAIFAPGKTPEAIMNRLGREIVRFLSNQDVRERFLKGQVEIVGSSPEQFADTLKSDIAKWDKVIKDAGIKVD